MLAVQKPHIAKTLGCGCGYMTKTPLGCSNNNKRKREDVDVAVPKLPMKKKKTITFDGVAELSATSNSSIRLAITRYKQVQLEKKRAVARVSLQAMEKEVDIDDNFETFKQLRKLCGGNEVVMGHFDLKPYGVDLVLKKEEKEEEHDCSSGLYQLSAIEKPSSHSKPSLNMEITTDQQVLLKKEREEFRASLLAMEKEADVDDHFKTFKEFRMLIGDVR